MSESVWERAPLLLHVGLHKTATTWLQKKYFAGAGDAAFHAFKDPRDVIGHIIVPHETYYDPEIPRADWRAFAEEAERKGLIGVITAEALSSYPFFSRFNRTMYARRLAETFPNAKILITIREQDSIIHSMYGQFVRFGYHHSLEEFLARPPAGSSFVSILEYEYYKFDLLFDLYKSLFGEGNVVIAPYEIFTADPEMLNQRLGALFGRTISPEVASLGQSKLNTGLSTAARFCQRNANRFASPQLKWRGGGFNPNAVGYWVDRFVPASARRRGFEKDMRLIREAVGDYYVSSNRRLAEQTGLPLSEAGYRV